MHRETGVGFSGSIDDSYDGSMLACPAASCLKRGKVCLYVCITPRLLKCTRCRGRSALVHSKSNSFSRIWCDDSWIWTCPHCDAERLFGANNPTGYADERVLDVVPMTSYNSSPFTFSDGELGVFYSSGTLLHAECNRNNQLTSVEMTS